MKVKKLLSAIIVCAMVFAVSVSVLADDETTTTNVASVGERQYATLQEAINAASSGDTITLLGNVAIYPEGKGDDVVSQLSIDKKLILNLAGYTIGYDSKVMTEELSYTPAFFSIAENGDVTITGNGKIDCEAGENNAYGIDVDGGSLIIENGTFLGAISAVQVEKGSLTVNGGTFDLASTCKEFVPGYAKYVINAIDDPYKDGTAIISVKGGTFINFDPSANPEGVGTSYVADGYYVTDNGDGTYTVAFKAAKIGDTIYPSLKAAVEAASSGDTITLLNDITEPSEETLIVYDLTGKTLDLNGFTYTAPNFSHVFEGSNAAIKNGKMSANGGSYALFVGDEDTTDNFIVDGVTLSGGVNIYNASNVVLRNLTATGMDYYAVWLDANAFATVESGVYTAGNVALFGATEQNGIISALTVTGGTFNANGKNILADSGGKLDIYGGTFSADVTEYTADGYVLKDNGDGTFTVQVGEWLSATDAGYYFDGETKYGMMRFLFSAHPASGTISEVGIKYSKANDITDDDVAKKGVSQTGNINNFYGDITGIPENATEAVYAAAYIKTTDDEIFWSDPISCVPNWTNNYSAYTVGGAE